MIDLDLSSSLQDIRIELDDHLAAINETTDEVETNFTYLINIEKKIKFLEKKIEHINKVLEKIAPEEFKSVKCGKVQISDKEQIVFSILYESPRAVDASQIAARLRRSETFVRYSINGLLSKGIPITKHIVNKKTHFSLDPEFKEIQAKENILNLPKTLTLDCFDQSIV